MISISMLLTGFPYFSTCYTAGECSSKGGSSQGSCAAGFGVCCICIVSNALVCILTLFYAVQVSATSSNIRENCTYITNPSYPRWLTHSTNIYNNYLLNILVIMPLLPLQLQSAIPSTSLRMVNIFLFGFLLFSLFPNLDVCRIRLDYDQFVLDGPVTTITANAATSGQCSTDRLTVNFFILTSDRVSLQMQWALTRPVQERERIFWNLLNPIQFGLRKLHWSSRGGAILPQLGHYIKK